jgi:hypothetical protein
MPRRLFVFDSVDSSNNKAFSGVPSGIFKTSIIISETGAPQAAAPLVKSGIPAQKPAKLVVVVLIAQKARFVRLYNKIYACQES